ncbi:lysine-rich arabinogalactan protein 18-like [Lotus japonicus]|uniref:lysine-rich arabinogalactan protein 18-like n=1 Tax=Lotus japonicus TaxID=34305 RepID=UPI00258DF783|nr:lysine-rich arabinogalactan protein 18-like [Lotus japonicus]
MASMFWPLALAILCYPLASNSINAQSPAGAPSNLATSTSAPVKSPVPKATTPTSSPAKLPVPKATTKVLNIGRGRGCGRVAVFAITDNIVAAVCVAPVAV